MKSAYESPTKQTLSRSRGKKLSRVGKRVPDMYDAFRFWRKLNHFRGNQRSCSMKNQDRSVLCSTYDNIFRNKFLKLCFLHGHAFGYTAGTT